ncbi:hypothetical protein EKH57_16220 [Halorubrum sp. BOL3-1]|uniref:hypothetical protein n=1 Tax=Halorubrum sp. BOL3-1 TaxID=2497325 RepID=UPI001004E7F7|nr:hypothetical protein [Halorubrum sp. BOL3-1]QAU14113.1 hypothetical protein EKH57_16220 [Halorubrum sp. BOL3-1]
MRTIDRCRWITTLSGVGIGLAVASVHWSGLFVLGALVGLPQRSLGRALLAGAVVGLLTLLLTALLAPVPRTTLMSLAPLTYVTLAFGLAPVVGSLVQGAV